jgi:hypothetical protein
MVTKKFTCRTEDVPVIGKFILNSAERDIRDFSAYSSVFSVDYFAMVSSKIEVCSELVQSSVISKELEGVTLQLRDKTKTLRSKLNALEGYLKFINVPLDIAVESIGFKYVRYDISRGNIKGLLSNMQFSLTAVKRNLPVLEAQGMKRSLIIDIEACLQEIGVLYEKQNALTVKRDRLTVENMGKFNDLWRSLRLIMNAAKAIYSGIDETKLQDYTVVHLRKRMHAGR